MHVHHEIMDHAYQELTSASQSIHQIECANRKHGSVFSTLSGHVTESSVTSETSLLSSSRQENAATTQIMKRMSPFQLPV